MTLLRFVPDLTRGCPPLSVAPEKGLCVGYWKPLHDAARRPPPCQSGRHRHSDRHPCHRRSYRCHRCMVTEEVDQRMEQHLKPPILVLL